MIDEKKIFEEIEHKLKLSDFKENINSNKKNIDNVILDKKFGIFIFLTIVIITLVAGIYLGQVLSNITSFLLSKLFIIINSIIDNVSIKYFLNRFVYVTLESIFTCAVQIFSIYTSIFILKECGYLSRGIFLIDKIMKYIGLNGNSFIPIINNFGCNVPGILSTRIIQDKNIRFLTILISPLISCPAKLPIYFLITGIYFSYAKQILIILLIYIYGIIIAIITSKIFSTIIINIKKNKIIDINNSFIEIPSYEFPNILLVIKISLKKAVDFIKHTGHLIIIFSFILWFFNNYPKTSDNEEKYIQKISKYTEPILKPLGFNSNMNIALIGGIFAKETIPAILKTLYKSNNNEDFKNIKNEIPLKNGISFIIFCSLYWPCINTILVIKNELNLMYCFLFTLYYTCLAFFSSFFFLHIL